MSGSSVSEKKLAKVNMTEDDWMALTNRPDVKEKEVIKLLDWFIKEGILFLYDYLFAFYKHNYN